MSFTDYLTRDKKTNLIRYTINNYLRDYRIIEEKWDKFLNEKITMEEWFSYYQCKARMNREKMLYHFQMKEYKKGLKFANKGEKASRMSMRIFFNEL